MVCFAVVLSADVASAQVSEELQAERAAEQLKTESMQFGKDFGQAIGMGVVLLGAGLGIGRIGGQAVEGMSRQPEASNNIQTGMLISAALIEGAAFAALVFITFLL